MVSFIQEHVQREDSVGSYHGLDYQQAKGKWNPGYIRPTKVTVPNIDSHSEADGFAGGETWVVFQSIIQTQYDQYFSLKSAFRHVWKNTIRTPSSLIEMALVWRWRKISTAGQIPDAFCEMDHVASSTQW
ncbi:uncharacterized protein Z520_12225 [Fonsecaea multimorphosa CBS 102226]|uniref:Uncharacterized protein n=1 Tax=Fonsecaea multimorphosa CBS 102226 TaxID=1442371 RepID=A0A0D2I430_9EURO|nr:uncharacterized protein Z520_12225 [Fonsecaea multimorphosa CBS 102226]KIX92071.1 hypothetical protein Z520_12225 [Fonsecaea multimorphosa CBS 102226]